MTISKRAKDLQTKPSAIMVGHEICSHSPYGLDNPKGHLNFGTAENHLLDDILLPKINQAPLLQSQHIQYTCLYGIQEVRSTICHFIQKFLNTGVLEPENLVIQTGVSAICESLSFALFDEGDIILIPTPYYTGFEHDFTKRFKCKFLKVPLNSHNDFTHDIDTFINTFESSEQKERIKGVLITHPHNPTGEILSHDFLEGITDFCLSKNLELISDEIYALSMHMETPHQSLFKLAKDKGCKVHLLYGMAKDFALAGLKVGFFYSDDQELLQSMKNLSYFHPVSSQTQIMVANLLADDPFVERIKERNAQSLQEIPILLNQQLPMYKFLPTAAGFFTLLDLTEYIKTFEEEEILFNKFMSYVKINMTPGKELGLAEPGYFRVCFARPKAEILEYIIRMRLFHENEL